MRSLEKEADKFLQICFQQIHHVDENGRARLDSTLYEAHTREPQLGSNKKISGETSGPEVRTADWCGGSPNNWATKFYFSLLLHTAHRPAAHGEESAEEDPSRLRGPPTAGGMEASRIAASVFPCRGAAAGAPLSLSFRVLGFHFSVFSMRIQRSSAFLWGS
jgi:hypothetical protein